MDDAKVISTFPSNIKTDPLTFAAISRLFSAQDEIVEREL